MDNYTLTIHKEKSVVLMELSGTITLAVLVAAAETLYADPDYNPAFSIIIDQRQAKFELGFNDLLSYINHISKNPKRLLGDTVFVAADPTNYGMGRMFENMKTDEFSDDIFFVKTVDEAFSLLADRAN